MNYLRAENNNIMLTSIDFKSNASDYKEFNIENEKKTIEELENELNDYSAKNYFAILEKGTNKFVGIIGFKNLIASNQRSNIDLILSKKLDKDKTICYGSSALNEIAKYAYSAINLHNLLCEESNPDLLLMYKEAGYEYIGARHFSVRKDVQLSDLYLFQKIQYKTKQDKILLPNEFLSIIPAKQSIDKLPDMVNMDGLTLLKPCLLDEREKQKTIIKLGESLNNSYVASEMGEYKMIYNDYRLNKKLDEKSGFDYLILDQAGEVIGYVDRLHIDDNNLRTDIEINIFDGFRSKGYGKKAYKAYTKTLRNAGYISVGSVVFGFNKPSMNLHKSVSFDLYAVRDESYYAYGRLCDMHYYEASFTEELGIAKAKRGEI